jgi:hypothetical protein
MAILESASRAMVDPTADPAALNEAPASAVAWAAIIGGACVTVAIALLLLQLGSGIGLASVSAWPGAGASATTFTVAAAIWLIVVQWLACAFGGYITGRLRTKWARLHSDEVFFRDTAHGFLTWAVAVLFAAALLGSVASSAIGGGARAVAGLVSGVAQGASEGASQGAGSMPGASYFIDSLFRSDQAGAGNTGAASSGSTAEQRTEVGGILAMAMRNGEMPAADKTYVAQLIARHTGLSQADAEKRIDGVMAQVKTAEDKVRAAADVARKGAASLAFFTFFSLLVGAFIASVAAAIGGRQRDAY